ncbi:axin interactor, dorsalization-associated protein-like isoform 1-T2 [Salvelinus alpinus]
MEMDEIKPGPIVIELYKKPTDFKRKKLQLLTKKPTDFKRKKLQLLTKKPTDFKRKKLQLLTKKPLYLHLHQTLHKD